MKRLLVYVLLVVTSSTFVVAQQEATFNSLSSGPSALLDIGPANVDLSAQNLTNPQENPGYSPGVTGNLALPPASIGTLGNSINFENSAANGAMGNPGANMTGSGGGGGGSGSGGGGSGMPLVPYNQGIPGF